MNNRLMHVEIRGAVQGVGFRPFVYRLATELHLNGWISNSPQGISLEVEGPNERLCEFLHRLKADAPRAALLHYVEHSFSPENGYSSFEIRKSIDEGNKTTIILPDIATCRDCMHEVLTPTDRRYLYPFTNCTQCGPRFSIIEALPYDRANTSMKKFIMCTDCQREYDDPLDRRFHAQPNACPQCGPHLELWDSSGKIIETHHPALVEAAARVRNGEILALKGLGGFLFIVDARNDRAVNRLRQKKHREAKPFALLFPSIDAVREDCDVSNLHEGLLESTASPIVLIDRKQIRDNTRWNIASSVAPGNPRLGVMLPYSPLHHLLMREFGFPAVATSGNISDEPICIDEEEALDRLKGIADVFLVHNRPIVRQVDDSVVQMVLGRPQILRRSRGYAPLPVPVDSERNISILGVGAHLKNTAALRVDQNIFISQHIGDLETKKADDAFQKIIQDFQSMYHASPKFIACDLHPDYRSTHFARESGSDVIPVQHHYAHVAACMGEHELKPPVLGVSWDGTGYGSDGTIWGGEFLLATAHSFERVAYLRKFTLPGSEKAIIEPRRSALGVLYEIFGKDVFLRDDLFPLKHFSRHELALLVQMVIRHVNSPITSSAGRLFDAVASLIDIRQTVQFEGQAAMELEFLIAASTSLETYDMPLSQDENRVTIIDWQPMIVEIIDDLRHGISRETISIKFHNTLAACVVEVARRVGEKSVILTGGCFQNRYLTERTVRSLEAEGFHVYWHQQVPPNDGGISYGQIVAALRSPLLSMGREQSTVEHLVET